MSDGTDGLSFPTSLGTSSADQIRLLGQDLTADLMGKVGFGELAFWLVAMRRPTPSETRVFEAVLVALADHGFTPTAIAARLTYLSAPDSLQGALAAGLLGGGSRFLGVTEDCGIYLHDVLELVTGINQGYLSAQALCERLIGHYDAVVAAVTSDTGRDALARMQNPRFNEWATESATWRDPAEQARIAAQIERARGFDRQLWRSWGPKLRDGALILLLLAGIVGVLIYSTFVRQP